MTELVTVREPSLVLSEEELGIMQMALIRGMNSENPYFREHCEKLLYKLLDSMMGFSEAEPTSLEVVADADALANNQAEIADGD